MRKILIVEDEQGLVTTLSDRLESEGFKVETAADGDTGREKALQGGFDLIILDVMLPKSNGYDVCRDIRAEGVRSPVIMLTAKNETIDKVLGLKLGADDYVAKPFEMMELLARIEAQLRRSSANGGSDNLTRYAFDDLIIDFENAEVLKGRKPLELSAMEFKLLHYLVENQGKVHTRNELLDAVWGYDAMPTTRTVDVHIAWLRQKLERNPRKPRHIQTVHGLGYKFVA